MNYSLSKVSKNIYNVTLEVSEQMYDDHQAIDEVKLFNAMKQLEKTEESSTESSEEHVEKIVREIVGFGRQEITHEPACQCQLSAGAVRLLRTVEVRLSITVEVFAADVLDATDVADALLEKIRHLQLEQPLVRPSRYADFCGSR